MKKMIWFLVLPYMVTTPEHCLKYPVCYVVAGQEFDDKQYAEEFAKAMNKATQLFDGGREPGEI